MSWLGVSLSSLLLQAIRLVMATKAIKNFFILNGGSFDFGAKIQNNCQLMVML